MSTNVIIRVLAESAGTVRTVWTNANTVSKLAVGGYVAGAAGYNMQSSYNHAKVALLDYREKNGEKVTQSGEIKSMVNAVSALRWSDTFSSFLWPINIWVWTMPNIVLAMNPRPTDYVKEPVHQEPGSKFETPQQVDKQVTENLVDLAKLGSLK